MNIKPGTPMIMEFSNRERMNCRYVGMSRDEFILLKVPMVPGIRNRLAEGLFHQFRFLNDGTIYGFGADVLQYQASPVSLVFLSYPHEFSEYNLRNEGRVECRFPASLMVGDDTIQGFIVDMSTRGCRFVFEATTSPKIEDDAPVMGFFSTMEGTRQYEFKGTVKTRQIQDQEKELGILFSGEIRLPEGMNVFFESEEGAETAAMSSSK
ncbi:flagellar brake protein [Pseudodesulfovibrio sediminis]|uniref:PilZ domain-containing protein n=1 Tax=Pseudodesulfovibrio sediminis TaxID=2810563 RepID=A0ABN6ER68_9BACT|nr:flagellar brake protein [Pseudodesulfovibrio sediminis]BCS87715.1 hypothetical protein PSDVSF_09570 [Pseudodesulfovibrio sediminis]